MAATIVQLSKRIKSGVEYGTISASFTTAQVKGLGTATVLIADPGTGKTIVLDKCVYSLTFAAAAFATSVTLNIITDTATLQQCAINIDDSASILKQIVPIGTASSGVGYNLVSHKGLTIVTSDAVNPTGGGTSTITLYIDYQIKNI